MHIAFNNISKSYGKHQVLRDISFSADGGSCIGILGANGSGKSTFLSVLAGTLTPDSGEFLFDDKNLFADGKRRSQLVGYVPQGTPLIEELTAWDNLLLWYDRKELNKQLDGGILYMLGIHEFVKKPVRKLSGGMKKRLSIGCAMAKRPPILLLDEPTAALDLACKEKIWQYLENYKQSGGLILLTTHDVQELMLCDRLYMLKDGTAQAYTYTGDWKKLVESL